MGSIMIPYRHLDLSYIVLTLWGIMPDPNREQDIQLVKECLQGSDAAWAVFYGRYIGLVRKTVRRRCGLTMRDEVEDVTQNVFISVISSLKSYDPSYSLSRFVGTVAERISIQEYRLKTASKRDGKTNPVDHHDRGDEGDVPLANGTRSQEDQLSMQQLGEILRQGLNRLDKACRELLRLRYYEDIPYQEIAVDLGRPVNTLKVQVKRCLDALRAEYHGLVRKGGERP